MRPTYAIATMTLARGDAEKEMLLGSLGVLARLGRPFYAADGGSGPAFLTAAGQISNIRIAAEGSNLVEQVKSAIRRAAASGAEIVIYTEPDKTAFFEDGLEDLAARASTENVAVLLPARDHASFATFPEGQRRMEKMFQELAEFFLGPLPDLLYGPLALRTRFAVPYVEAAPVELGWGWRPYLIARAIREGKGIASYEACLPCPEEQRAEDDPGSRIYRLKQFQDNVAGLRAGLEAAISHP